MNSFETDFWLPFDKKVGRDKCLKKWSLITPQDQILISKHVPGFVREKRNKQYRPNPLSYLNGKMWLDEGGDETSSLVYKMPKPPTVSTYKAETFDRADFIAHLRKRIEAYYKSGKAIEDYGGAITSFLIERLQMSVPKDVKHALKQKVFEESIRIRKRQEEPYIGSVESDARDAELRWWLNDQKEKSINVVSLI